MVAQVRVLDAYDQYPPYSSLNFLVLKIIISCACELMLLFSVVFHLVTVVHKFDFRLVIKWTSSNQWKVLDAVKFWKDLFDFSPRTAERYQALATSSQSHSLWDDNSTPTVSVENMEAGWNCKISLPCVKNRNWILYVCNPNNGYGRGNG